jgi:hypothetical protein
VEGFPGRGFSEQRFQAPILRDIDLSGLAMTNTSAATQCGLIGSESGTNEWKVSRQAQNDLLVSQKNPQVRYAVTRATAAPLGFLLPNS